MIIEEPIENLPTPYFKINKSTDPQSNNKNLPPLFFSCLIVGSKNSGKSYAMTSLLKMFEENPIYDNKGNELNQRIILFSPTANNLSNVVFKNLKYLSPDDIHLEYTDEKLDEILKEIKSNIDEVNKYEDYIKLIDKYNNTNLELTDDEYMILYNNRNNLMEIEEKRHTITHFCFDDLIGDKEVFKKARDSGLVKFLLKHRHLYTNIFITSQYINSITPVIKSNIDIFCLFKYANLNDILKKFYPSVSGIMSEEKFKELYLYSTNEKYNFLSVISHNMLKGRLLIRKNWNINLKIIKE
jgi:hypothetical protein